MGGGVYGTMTLSFPEVLQEFPYFEMDAKQGSGYEARKNLKLVKGVFQCTTGRNVKDSHGNLVRTRETRFWTTEVLTVGNFMEAEDDVYRVGVPDNTWQREGGMTVYDLHKLVGDDGRAAVEPAFAKGEGHFA